jgi:hypothetical protein
MANGSNRLRNAVTNKDIKPVRINGKQHIGPHIPTQHKSEMRKTPQPTPRPPNDSSVSELVPISTVLCNPLKLELEPPPPLPLPEHKLPSICLLNVTSP